MKKNFKLLAVLPVFLAVILPVALAQDESAVEPQPEPESTSYESSDASTVVYEEPTTYYASVVYQSAVIYNAPVYYIAAGAALAVNYAEQPQTPAEPQAPASTIIVVGGGSGTRVYTSPPPSSAPSQLIHFGQRGSSWFGR
jgi:hypothetical protein